MLRVVLTAGSITHQKSSSGPVHRTARLHDEIQRLFCFFANCTAKACTGSNRGVLPAPRGHSRLTPSLS
jgi:hypothetical protein